MILQSPPQKDQLLGIVGYSPDNFESNALGTINSEKVQWDPLAVNVTDGVQYLVRNVIKKARRNYAGVFETQYDEVTGDKKIWDPTTNIAVENVVKSVDLDTKDILVDPAKPSSVGIARVIKSAIFNLLKKIGFGQLLNDFTTVVARDGTVVVKSYVEINPNTKKKYIKSNIVDMLNLWVDPTANNIQESTVIERSIKTKAEIDAYSGVWDNLDVVAYSGQVDKLYNIQNVAGGYVPTTEVWERWGLMPLSWITKKDKDNDTLIEGHIVASGIGSPMVIHYIGKNTRENFRKPYEECWYKRIPGRWPGVGVPELLFDLQQYANEVVNTRRINNKVLQNGIFLIRKGSGITPDMLNAITAGGGLPVTNVVNDIKQLQVQDFRQSSYTDEDRIQLMADRVTGAFDITRGEVGRASASATATLTRDRNIRDTFVLIQENIGFFIERLIRFQYIPLMKEIMTEEDFIKITGDSDYLAFIDEQIINNRKNQFIKDGIETTGFYPEQTELDDFVAKQAQSLKSMGKQRFVKYFNGMFDEEVDIEVHITDEKFNRIVAAQQLRDMLVAYSRLPVASKLDTDAIMREMLNIMGIKGEFFMEKAQIPASSMQPGPRLMKELPGGLPSETTAFQNAAGFPQQQPLQQTGPLQTAEPFQQQLRINTGLSNIG